MLAKISDLRDRQAININDGKCLGPVRDIEIDMETGRIKALILPGVGKLFSFFPNRDEMIIPWENVIRIGIDVLLVEFAVEEKVEKKPRSRRGQNYWQDELEEYKQEINQI